MFKNVASQKITLLAIDTAANVPKTGDSANITAYVSIDDGAVTAITDTSAAELDATNAPGLYSFDVTQAETNGDKLLFSAKSSTADVRIVPVAIYTRAANINDLVIDGSGNITAGITGNLTGNVSGSVGSVTGPVLLTVGTGTGEVNLSSGKVPATIAAGDLANDSITADAIANDAATEIATAVAAPSASTIASAVWGFVIENSKSATSLMRLMYAALCGKSAVSGSTRTFRDDADTKDRITATTDTSGQRTAVTKDAS